MQGLLPLFLAACVACVSPSTIKPSGPGGPPNVVLIVADDQGYADLGCAGLADDVVTPNLDRLAAAGVRFTQAYATSPICNPSRAGLQTGCYQQRYGVSWYGGPGIHDASYPTIAERMKDAGYATGYFGKVHYGKGDSDPTDRNFPLGHGFDRFFGATSARKHYLHHRAELEAAFLESKREHGRKGQSLRQGPLWDDAEKVDVDGFSTELFGERACAWIRERGDEAFFLQLSFNAVHNFTHQLPAESLEEQGLEGYRDWDPAVEEYYDWYVQGRKPNCPEGRAYYLGQLHFLDREVGRVLDCLRERGLAENTLVLYVGDNGGSTPIYADNGPLRGSKYTLYEGGIRVPLIVSWPGRFDAGIVSDNVVSAMDLLPTICAAAGVDASGSLDGFDLAPLLTGADPNLHHDLLVWDTGHETALRRGKWKLRTATEDRHAQYEMVELETGVFLYDLEADPGETCNLATEYPDVLQVLQVTHAAWREGIDG